MFKETTADLAEVGLVLVELFLQAFQKLPLESVDLFYIAKDCTDVLFSEHVCPLTTLFDVTLSKTKRTKRVRTHRTSIIPLVQSVSITVHANITLMALLDSPQSKLILACEFRLWGDVMHDHIQYCQI